MDFESWISVPHVNSSNMSFDTTTTVIQGASHYSQYKFASWLDAYAIYIITSISLVGNMTAILTICSMKPISSTSIYIAVLSVVDSMCLVFKILVTHVVKEASLPQEFSCGFFMFLFLLFQYSASWVIVLVSLERCIAVWFPFKVTSMFTKRRAVISLVVLTIIFATCSAWTFWIYERHVSDKWGTICVSKLEQVPAMKILRKIHPFLYIIIPFQLLIVFNVLIVVGLRKAYRLRSSLRSKNKTSTHDSGASRLTAMLVVTSVTFIVLETPMVVLCLFRYYSREGTKAFVDDKLFVEVAQSLEDLNHAVNCLLYFIAGTKFRQKFIEQILEKICKKPTAAQQITLTSLRGSCRSLNEPPETRKLLVFPPSPNLTPDYCLKTSSISQTFV